jgi:hypothetical protein
MSDRGNSHPEVEIIPPGAPDPVRRNDQRGKDRARVWAWSNDPRYGGLRYGGPGPLGVVAIVAALAGLGALGLFIFLGALAITLPLIGAVVLAGILGGILRRL